MALALAAAVHAAPQPASPQVSQLQSALTTYRQLAAAAWPPLPKPARPIRPGDPYPSAPALHARLVQFGDLSSSVPPPAAGLFTEELAAGLMQFQQRHGLAEDGVLGPQTSAALAVPPADRVRQIEQALEVVGALPADDGRWVMVNIPMFRLWAWDHGLWQGPPALDKRVIVGAVKTPTPSLQAVMDGVTFRPYWNVPASIAQGELLPKIRTDPAYLARHHYEVVSPPGAAVQLRQRPGPGNALGLVRFDFPNPHSVFMHDTPTPALFGRPDRALSHGCVRVQEPGDLAVWALADDAWTPDAVQAAMAGTNNRRVPIARPVGVLLVYATALVAPDGRIHFARDIYRRLDGRTTPASQPSCRPDSDLG